MSHSATTTAVQDRTLPMGETPLPRKQVFVLMCVQLSEALSINMLFPVVPFLVRSFPEVDSNDPSAVSSTASVVASCFNAAQFLSSFWWGSTSDRYGRRPTMLLGLLGSFVCIIAFGCADTLVSAIAVRVLHGLLNGNAGYAVHDAVQRPYFILFP